MTGWQRKVFRSGDTIYVDSLSRAPDVSDFLKEITDAFIKSGFEYINIDFEKVEGAFPNACVPIAAAVAFYRQQGYEINLRGVSRFLREANIDVPREAKADEDYTVGHVFSRTWKFTNPRQVARLTDAIPSALAERVECEKGVVDAFVWCLSEIMDNILQHSNSEEGFVMAQVHSERKRVAVCVADNGIGIPASLRNSPFHPANDVDAITMAMKEGVTRNKELHQGNGLWGLNEIVEANGGIMQIKSGKAAVFRTRTGEVRTYARLPVLDHKFPGTVVDFQIETSKPISLSKALSGHEPVSLRLEGFEAEGGEFLVKVSEHSHGTGTRIAATQLRNLIVNLINEKHSRITVDFSGIGIISSSFADELIGKLVVKFGFFNFQQVLELKGMNETVQAIVHRSVAQRMIESLKHTPSGSEAGK